MAGNANSGRKKLPAEVLRLRGTNVPGRPRGASVNDRKIKSIQACVKVEGYSLMNKRTRRVYLSLCRRLIAMKMLESIFLPELSVYAREFDLYLTCSDDLSRNGMYVPLTDRHGNIVKYVENPSARQLNRHVANIKALGSNFGFSPVDRQRIREELNTESPTINIMNFINGAGGGPDEQ